MPQRGSTEQAYLRNTFPLREVFRKRTLPAWPPFSVTSAPAGGSRRGVPLTGVGNSQIRIKTPRTNCNGAAGQSCNQSPKHCCKTSGSRQMHIPPWLWFSTTVAGPPIWNFQPCARVDSNRIQIGAAASGHSWSCHDDRQLAFGPFCLPCAAVVVGECLIIIGGVSEWTQRSSATSVSPRLREKAGWPSSAASSTTTASGMTGSTPTSPPAGSCVARHGSSSGRRSSWATSSWSRGSTAWRGT